MLKRKTLVQSTLVTVLLSPLLLALPAHAGLLGGGAGAVTGGLSSGWGGGFAPGRMDIGGMAAGQASGRQGPPLSRGENLGQQTGSVKQASSANNSEQGSVSHQRADMPGSDLMGAAMAGANLSRGTAQKPGGATSQAKGPDGASATGNHETTSSSRQADAAVNGSGSAQTSRESISADSDASAQASASR